MNKKVNLVLFDDSTFPIEWKLGEVYRVKFSVQDVFNVITQHIKTTSEAVLFWHPDSGKPDQEKVQHLLGQAIDVWHAGLRMGMNGLPGTIDFVVPTWMLNCDPDPKIESTSWRLSLRACLIRTDVLRKMGGIYPEFQTLEAASLEMGHRFITRGVLTRYIPSLISSQKQLNNVSLPFEDELRFIDFCFGRKWTLWAWARAVMTRYATFQKAWSSWNEVKKSKGREESDPYQRVFANSAAPHKKSLVSVLIPTLQRYSYLRTILRQFKEQTIKPFEIIVIDQTPMSQRDVELRKEFEDLPLKLIYLEKPGQCSARNAGLKMAEGDFILFLDDDDEITPDLIESHLQSLHLFQNRVSSGVADEVGAGPLPKNFRYRRTSDVFPTNNTMIHRGVLEKSGLFDLAYDHKQRADGDLGMRVYLAGEQMILNSKISVLHHHAPQGGLRVHKARVITYASSRSNLFHRHLPTDSEIYLARRYFTPRQVEEMLWLRIFGVFTIWGGVFKKIGKLFIAFLTLPNTVGVTLSRYRKASIMLKQFPQIPFFEKESMPFNDGRRILCAE